VEGGSIVSVTQYYDHLLLLFSIVILQYCCVKRNLLSIGIVSVEEIGHDTEKYILSTIAVPRDIGGI